MPVIDNTYFEALGIFIPNNKDISASPVGTPTVQTELDAAILKYDRELLLNAFGVTLYDELVTALGDLPGANQKWKDLVEGKSYTLDNKVYRWDGLRGYSKQSLVAQYVYCQYLKNDELTYTTTGMIKNQADNSQSASYISKYVKAYAEFIAQYQGNLYKYYTIHCERYGYRSEYLGYLDTLRIYDYYTRDVKASLWQYLNDANELDATAFPDFQFKIYAPYNRFGL